MMTDNRSKTWKLVVSLIAGLAILSATTLSAQQKGGVTLMRLAHRLVFLPQLSGDNNHHDGAIEASIEVPPLGSQSADAAAKFHLEGENGDRYPLAVSIPGAENKGNTLYVKDVNPSVGVQLDVSMKISKGLINSLRGRYDSPASFKLFAEMIFPVEGEYYLGDVMILDIPPKYQ